MELDAYCHLGGATIAVAFQSPVKYVFSTRNTRLNVAFCPPLPRERLLLFLLLLFLESFFAYLDDLELPVY